MEYFYLYVSIYFAGYLCFYVSTELQNFLHWMRSILFQGDAEYICRRMMRLELPGRRSRGRTERFMDVVTEDMELVGVKEE